MNLYIFAQKCFEQQIGSIASSKTLAENFLNSLLSGKYRIHMSEFMPLDSVT